MDELGGIYARSVPSLDATVQLGVASGKLIQCSFPATPEANAESEHELLDRIEAYAEQETEDDFRDVEIALTIPSDQRAVLQTLRTVPYGETTTVESLVRRTPGLDPDGDDAAATVQSALSANPIPLVLPDHRVDDGRGATPGAVRRRLRAIEGIES
ncbi:methylated-DNA--protein-cysteine methyltransferase [Salinarchaeum sp. Harcht-Bsk1]|uniref:MGMT family protein n=1 Tax=Salinarchaeum sp. Harcht-Bsk1 TaxID=1333523 RepID=UPI0003424439|nr:MGMT family protein [Salinarchaeum sp. Harcht-Bsk1]AGN02313.1 methylated-DNA--protein-cysteine methyltransferase [Salinarchaeum sp. Harcht-Bsk1]